MKDFLILCLVFLSLWLSAYCIWIQFDRYDYGTEMESKGFEEAYRQKGILFKNVTITGTGSGTILKIDCDNSITLGSGIVIEGK